MSMIKYKPGSSLITQDRCASMVSITCELNDSNKQNNVKLVMFSMNVYERFFELQDISVIKYYG